MSLHIESTENALAELKKQRTKTLTAAISVSFLGIALMGLLLYLVHIKAKTPAFLKNGENCPVQVCIAGLPVYKAGSVLKPDTPVCQSD